MQIQPRHVLLFAGVLLLAGAAVTALHTNRFIAHAAMRPGAVTRLNAGGSHPQINFTTQDGTLVSYPQGGMVAGFTAGQPVQVLFDPANPRATARVRSFGSLWGSSTTLAICGIVLLALASFAAPVTFYRK